VTRARAKLALLCASPFLSLLLVEIAVRVRDRVRGEPYSAWKTEQEWREILAATNANLQEQTTGVHGTFTDANEVSLHPYVGFEWNYTRDQIRDEVAYFASDESRQTFDILVVGSSVAGAFPRFAGAKLIEILRQDPRLAGRPIRVMSHGVGGYKEPQQALLVVYLLGLGYQPEVIIDIDGFNECVLSYDNASLACHPNFPSVDHWAHLAIGHSAGREATDHLLAMRERQLDAQRVLEFGLTYKLAYSALLGPHVTTRLQGLQADYVRAQREYSDYLTKTGNASLLGPRFEGGSEKALDLALSNWLECSRSIGALCAARSIHYLQVLQPTLHDEGSKMMAQAEMEHGPLTPEWVATIHAGYPRLRELGAKLRAEGLDFVDASRIFEHVSEPLYLDGCHFGAEGHALLADVISRALLAALPGQLESPGFQSAPAGDER
jgi:hypothetical protein